VVPLAPTNARLIISARDGAGNVATFTNKGDYGAAAEPMRLLLPVIIR
jgi:hypothetical protein